MKKIWVILIGIFIIVSPMAISSGADLFANLNGCDLDEGGVHPCVVGGKDYGSILYDMGMFFLLTVISLPIGFFVVIFGAVKKNAVSGEMLTDALIIYNRKRRAKKIIFVGIGLFLTVNVLSLLPFLGIYGLLMGTVNILGIVLIIVGGAMFFMSNKQVK